jgi:hypothetical protein
MIAEPLTPAELTPDLKVKWWWFDGTGGETALMWRARPVGMVVTRADTPSIEFEVRIRLDDDSASVQDAVAMLSTGRKLHLSE